jgi:hypothetical protein
VTLSLQKLLIANKRGLVLTFSEESLILLTVAGTHGTDVDVLHILYMSEYVYTTYYDLL